MKKVFACMKRFRTESILGPLFKLLEASFELLIPLVVAYIIDHGIGGGDKQTVIRMCLLMALLGVVGLAAAVSAQYFAAKAAVGTAKELRRGLLEKVQRLSYSELDSMGTATLMTRMTGDINQVQTGINLTLRLLLRSPFVVFGAMIMAFTVDARSALVFVCVIPLLFLAVMGIMMISAPLYRKAQERLDRLTAATRENLSGVRVIRAFGREEQEVADFRDKNERLTALNRFVGRISALTNPLTVCLVNLATVILIHTGAVRVDAGLLSQGQVVALYNYMAQILVELVKMANLIINVTRAVACANRLEGVFALPDEEDGEQKVAFPAGVPAVSFRDVSLTYRDAGGEALSHITFDAMPGETIGIIGGTGSGKSSLVQLIPAFYEATEGQVLVGGADVRTLSKRELRQAVGYVPQRSVLFRGTIRDNLCWGNPEAGEEDLHKALACAQAQEIVAARPEGLDAEVEQQGRNFSGGQKQRLCIARALVRGADILILDDSASALDYATDAALRKSLAALSPKPTVFVVSQRAASVMHANRIIVLEDGRAVGIGTHETLLSECPVYREIYESQFKKKATA